MTFNNVVDNDTEDNDSISFQKSVSLRIEQNNKYNEDILLKNKQINPSKQKKVCYISNCIITIYIIIKVKMLNFIKGCIIYQLIFLN